jgi:hypothetical protein
MRQIDQAPSNSATPSGAGGSPPAQTMKVKNRPVSGKIFRQKKKWNIPVSGAREIAHPVEKRAYERQMAEIEAWFFKTLEITESVDVEAANAARGDLQTLLLALVEQLLRIARKSTRGDARRWAGELLASIGQSVWKHHDKLSKANKAYEDESRKIGTLRSDLLFPKSRVTRAVKHELKKGKRYRETLLLFKEALRDGDSTILELSESEFGYGWIEAAKRQRISEV